MITHWYYKGWILVHQNKYIFLNYTPQPHIGTKIKCTVKCSICCFKGSRYGWQAKVDFTKSLDWYLLQINRSCLVKCDVTIQITMVILKICLAMIFTSEWNPPLELHWARCQPLLPWSWPWCPIKDTHMTVLEIFQRKCLKSCKLKTALLSQRWNSRP